jgi:hypothetical protein
MNTTQIIITALIIVFVILCIRFFLKNPLIKNNKTALSIFNIIMDDLQECKTKEDMYDNQDQFELFVDTWTELVVEDEMFFYESVYYKTLKKKQDELRKKTIG